MRFEPNIERAIFFLSAIKVFMTSSWLFAFVSFFTSLSIWRVFSFTWTVVGKANTYNYNYGSDLKGYSPFKHPRFKREFAVSRHQPFGKTSDYVECIEKADSKRTVKLIKVVGMLLQTKAYLFWGRAAECDA